MARKLLARTFTTTTDATAAWAHLADVTAWPSWARHIRRITLDPPGALTSETSGRLIIKPAIPTTFRVTALDAPHSWSWRGRFLGTILDYDHVVVPQPDGTARVTFAIEGSGPTVRVVGPVFAAVYARLLDRAISNLSKELDTLRD